MLATKAHSITTHASVEMAKRVDDIAAALTRAALTDVDAGYVVDHQAVQTWADSLSTDNPLPIPRC